MKICFKVESRLVHLCPITQPGLSSIFIRQGPSVWVGTEAQAAAPDARLKSSIWRSLMYVNRQQKPKLKE